MSLPPHPPLVLSLPPTPTDMVDPLFVLLPPSSVPTSPVMAICHSGKLVYHSEFYIKDDMTVFLVDNQILFRVHRYLLDRESDVFRSYPAGSDENPVPLQDVTSEEFATLLKYFYNGMHGDAPESRDEWMTLLSLSTLFKMPRIRNRAIKAIELFDPPLDPVCRIALAIPEKHDIQEWLKPAYVELCRRDDPISEHDADKLGLNITVGIFHARERSRKLAVRKPASDMRHGQMGLFGGGPAYPPIPGPGPDLPPDMELVERIVTEVFWPPQNKTP
ncbi:hypothetical protein PILCRDRAFT_828296 [Piloderma croceum F 1598]|uniref:BTB domain-containing protein n=1 Tax=Piloderma croceum (strain F 1598) TaxID=765440 RepID=A0A0C3BAT6_PILCF|nr:hypothetical protein PILCRDRAFT_828296 [Piloderma croceum F 1598]